MAVTDYIPSTLPGSWPAPSTDAPYVAALRVGYEDTMHLRMQEFRARAAKMAARQVVLKGYETRIGRWGKASLVQRTRAGFIGDDLTGGAPAAETAVNTFVIRAAHWEHPEYFDLRDELGLDMMIGALVSAEYQENVLGALNRKCDEVFFTEMIADVNLGDGGGTQTFTAGGGVKPDGKIQDDGTVGAVISKLNHRKLLEILSTLQQNDAWTGPTENFIALHPIQLKQLFLESSTPLTTGDYNSLRPLMGGDVTQYLGMTWILTTNMPAVADIDTGSAGSQAGHYCYAWNKRAMVNGVGRQTAWTRDIPVRGETVLFYHGAFVGALRQDSLGVTYVECADADAAPA